MGIKRRMDTCQPIDMTPFLNLDLRINNVSMKMSPKQIVYVISYQIVKLHPIEDLVTTIVNDRTLNSDTSILQRIFKKITYLHYYVMNFY